MQSRAHKMLRNIWCCAHAWTRIGDLTIETEPHRELKSTNTKREQRETWNNWCVLTRKAYQKRLLKKEKLFNSININNYYSVHIMAVLLLCCLFSHSFCLMSFLAVCGVRINGFSLNNMVMSCFMADTFYLKCHQQSI